MSSPARRGHARIRPAWSRPTIGARFRRFVWRIVRAFLLLGAALGPGLPPPPPPPPAPTEQVYDEGESGDRES